MKTALLIAAFALSGAVASHDVIHANHKGKHTPDDGHIKIMHNGHIDHLHDGHLHHQDGDHVDEHVLEVTDTNPSIENHTKDCDHKHSMGDKKHPMIQHGDHFDFLHNGRLHHVHGDHVDDHGPVNIVE